MPIASVFRPDAFKRKPRAHQAEIDPQGRLRNSLASVILFEPGAWQRDYILPGRTFTPTNTIIYADGDFGGTVSTGASAPAPWLTLSPGIATPGAWTVSNLIYINGSVPLATSIFGTDGSFNVYFVIQGTLTGATPGGLSVNGTTAVIGSWNFANFTGWHRITVTASAQTGTATFYFDGVSQGTGSIVTGTTALSSFLGDGTNSSNVNIPVSDLFVWTYKMPATEVAAHAADPYGTTLRPRYNLLGRAPSAMVFNACVAPSMMTLGVGP